MPLGRSRTGARQAVRHRAFSRPGTGHGVVAPDTAPTERRVAGGAHRLHPGGLRDDFAITSPDRSRPLGASWSTLRRAVPDAPSRPLNARSPVIRVNVELCARRLPSDSNALACDGVRPPRCTHARGSATVTQVAPPSFVRRRTVVTLRPHIINPSEALVKAIGDALKQRTSPIGVKRRPPPLTR